MSLENEPASNDAKTERETGASRGGGSEGPRIALVGNYDAAKIAHRAIPLALEIARRISGVNVSWEWIESESIEPYDATPRLAAFDAVWCVPGSPYASFHGALSAIRFARENGVPFLGTCGGFQHALIEYARSVLGMHAADHAETNPDADVLVISPLACSLIETGEAISLMPGSRVAQIYGRKEIFETYRCSYGLNADFETRLTVGGELAVCGRDSAGQVRVVELVSHPFFFCTLFQPERSGLSGNSHPLVEAFVSAAADFSSSRRL